MSEPNGRSRPDRIELNLEKPVVVAHRLAVHKQIMNGLIRQIGEAQLKLDIAQNLTRNNLNALRKIVDDRVRNRPELGA